MGEVIPDMKGVWIAVGSAEHWQLAFDQGGIWGLVESHEPQWKRLTRGDMVFCYAKSPISGLVGYGQVTKTFRQNVPLWPPEVRENKVIWPLRFEFDLIYLVPTPRWKSECVKLAEIPKYRLQSGFIEISDELAARLAERFPQALTLASQTKEQRPPYPAVAGHDEIQAMLLQIGTFQRFIAEKEYPLEKERLDVVWRKVVSVFIQGITTSLPLAGLRETGVGTCWLSSLVILLQDDAFCVLLLSRLTILYCSGSPKRL